MRWCVLVAAGAIGDRARIDRLVHTDSVGDARLCDDMQLSATR